MPTSYKVVLLGEGRVGKTSLVSRFFNANFDENQASTVQAAMHTSAEVPLLDGSGATVALNVWDTAGQERFHALGPIYYRNANGALLVYDITDADSFEKVRVWIRELRAVVGGDIQLVICGNKSDLSARRDVAEETAVAFARTHGAQHIETSAKTGANVAEAFQALATAIVRATPKRGSCGVAHPRGGGLTTAPPPARRGRCNALRVWVTEGEAGAGGAGGNNVPAAGVDHSAGDVAADACALSSEDYIYINDFTGKPARLFTTDLVTPADFTKDKLPASGGRFGCCA